MFFDDVQLAVGHQYFCSEHQP